MIYYNVYITRCGWRVSNTVYLPIFFPKLIIRNYTFRGRRREMQINDELLLFFNFYPVRSSIRGIKPREIFAFVCKQRVYKYTPGIDGGGAPGPSPEFVRRVNTYNTIFPTRWNVTSRRSWRNGQVKSLSYPFLRCLTVFLRYWKSRPFRRDKHAALTYARRSHDVHIDRPDALHESELASRG